MHRVNMIIAFGALLVAPTITANAKALDDHALYAKGFSLDRACDTAVKKKSTLRIGQKWHVINATCEADVLFADSGSIDFDGRLVFVRSVKGTPALHLVPTGPESVVVFQNISNPTHIAWWGAKADGSDETQLFQHAVDSLNQSGGGKLIIDAKPACYVVNSIRFYSRITLEGETQTSCVRKRPGSQENPASVFHNDPNEPVTDVHFRKFTIDGNRDNISGVSGDGGNFGIIFFGATNSSVEDMVIKDAYTDGIAVDGAGPGRRVMGSQLSILRTKVLHSRRNNISLLAGINTKIEDCELAFASGTSPQAGLDVEQYQPGAYVTGLDIENTEAHNNAADGLLLNLTHQADPQLEIFVRNARSHDNGKSGLNALNFTGFGKLVISGGTFADNGGCCGINLAGWKQVTLTNEVVYGSQRGVLLSSGNPDVHFSAGKISGTLYDLSVDGLDSLAILDGVSLEHDKIQPGEETRVKRLSADH